METKIKKPFSRLYIKISAIFILVLVIFALITLYISVNAARNYSIEVNQKLNWNLAKSTVDVIKPEFVNGEVKKEAIADIMHSMMVINPSVEVYLLNPQGRILSYVAPEKVVKLNEVSLLPILKFIKDEKHKMIYGDDPRNPSEKKTFSAAEITDKGKLSGYIYIVLASQEYISASQMVLGSYILGISFKSIIAILIVSALIGLLALWYITKKLNVIIFGIQKFKAGNLGTRIPLSSDDELDKIGHIFNEMAETVEKSIEELKGIDDLRKELISNVSHDLRTPVASIQGYAETLLLKEGKIDKEEEHKYLQIIVKSCERLKKLVEELFELSKLQSNQVELNREPFSIVELVTDITNKYRILSQKKGISINTFMSKETPVVDADISLIDRVLQNLIDNAIKFCREGDYINIHINPHDTEKVEISISDSGAGIKGEQLPKIFERFFKDGHNEGSTGLGLAIVKKIIDLHQTNINVESIPGKGSKFSFWLPVANVI